MKTEYKNAQRSKALIKEAMLNLLNKKELEDITVTDIVKYANINRGTFYNHYGNPAEILEEIKDQLMQKLADALKEGTTKNDVQSFVKTLIEHFKKNEKEYKRIATAIPMSVIENLKGELIKQILKFDIKMEPITFYFVVNGITGLCLDYLKGNVTFSYEQLEQKLIQFINVGLKQNA